MKKTSLLVSAVVLVAAIVLVIVLLMNSRADTEIQNIEPVNKELVFENVQTQIYEQKSFLEKISASADSDISSILKRENPLNVFEDMRRQMTETETGANLRLESPIFQNLKPPKVFSVSPDYVRKGDSVTITGENFTPTNNTVTLGDGPVGVTFTNLISPDGKTITFVYQPPIIKTMNEGEIRALPADIVSQIETPIKTAGTTLTKALAANNEIRDEAQMLDILQKNGYSPDAMYHYFHIIVENSQGDGISKTALLYGLRNTIQSEVVNNKDPSLLEKFARYLDDFTGGLIPTAYAQIGQSGGGFTAGIVMICTCNGNVLTFQTSYSGGGSGLYVFSPSFRPSAGSGRVAGFWLGGYQTMSGSCTIYAGITCITIMGNTPLNPVGYSS